MVSIVITVLYIYSRPVVAAIFLLLLYTAAPWLQLYSYSSNLMGENLRFSDSAESENQFAFISNINLSPLCTVLHTALQYNTIHVYVIYWCSTTIPYIYLLLYTSAALQYIQYIYLFYTGAALQYIQYIYLLYTGAALQYIQYIYLLYCILAQ